MAAVGSEFACGWLKFVRKPWKSTAELRQESDVAVFKRRPCNTNMLRSERFWFCGVHGQREIAGNSFLKRMSDVATLPIVSRYPSNMQYPCNPVSKLGNSLVVEKCAARNFPNLEMGAKGVTTLTCATLKLKPLNYRTRTTKTLKSKPLKH